MSHRQVYEANDWDYGMDSFRNVERVGSTKRPRPTMGRQRGKSAQSMNGIHRRRRRKITW